MRETFDARVVPPEVVLFLRELSRRAPFELAGGAALSGVISGQGLANLRASKLTCLLSRSEPRDLVDMLFLERAGFRAEADLSLAAKKDTGVDPGVMGWLLGQFPLSPMPQMLEPLSEAELKAYRDELRERFRALAKK